MPFKEAVRAPGESVPPARSSFATLDARYRYGARCGAPPKEMGDLMRKLFVPIMAAAMFCAAALGGCGGPSAEETIRAELNAGFEEAMSQSDKIAEGVESSAGDEFEMLGIDSDEYVDSFLEGLAFEVGEIVVDEDAGTATAEVAITAKNMTKIVDEWTTQFNAYVAGIDFESLSSADELYKAGGDLMMTVTDAAEPEVTEHTFNLAKDDDGEWTIDEDEVSQAFSVAMMG